MGMPTFEDLLLKTVIWYQQQRDPFQDLADDDREEIKDSDVRSIDFQAIEQMKGLPHAYNSEPRQAQFTFR
ncbi:hypothetical protein N7528_009990 [Penicillium herquei]|nr:hypothetical protein N7528_009990 [Penicillium herquei]